MSVRRAVLIAHGGIYGFDNTYMIESAAAYPDQLRVVAAIDVDKLSPEDVEAAMWDLLPQRVTGFRIERLCDKGNPAWLHSPGMDAMWRVAAETGQAVCAMMHPEDIEHIDVMCERFPDTIVVLDHLASVRNLRNHFQASIDCVPYFQPCHVGRSRWVKTLGSEGQALWSRATQQN